MAAQTGTAALAASTSLRVGGLKWILGGVTQYYATETSVFPSIPYTTENGALSYTAEDGVTQYTTESARSRYITEAGVSAVGPFYVATIGGPPAVIMAASTVLTARPKAAFQTTAAFSAGAGLFVSPGVGLRATAAMAAGATLSASARFALGGTAALAARATLTAGAFSPGFLPPFAAITRLLAAPLLHAVASAALSAQTTLFAGPGVPAASTAEFDAATTLFADGTVVQAPQVLAQARLAASTTMFAYSARVPYPPSIVGHTLVYVVTAPNGWELTSDPVTGPLLSNTNVSVYQTLTTSSEPLEGSWNVIFKFNQPFDVALALSQKCVLIYDLTALVGRQDIVHVILKNDLPIPLSKIEIILDGFSSLIMPGQLPSLIETD